MASANGYLVQCHHGEKHRASWPAPWFVFQASELDEPCACMLRHCETHAHALELKTAQGGRLLNYAFEMCRSRPTDDVTRARVAEQLELLEPAGEPAAVRAANPEERAYARSVACPSCGVGVGQRCRRPSGHAAMTAHADRLNLAWQQRAR